jgi:hypothetical protein
VLSERAPLRASGVLHIAEIDLPSDIFMDSITWRDIGK